MTASPATPTPTPARIPLPPEFPIEWPEPALADLFWQQDRMHVPEPHTPMSAWLAEVFSRGFTAGLKAYSVPMGVRVGRFNTYFYMAIGPDVPPEAMPEMEARSMVAIQDAVGSFWQRWEQEWLPELQRGWAEWNSRDLTTLTDTELDAFVDYAVSWYERVWTIHFELLVPAMAGASLFQDLYADLFPSPDPLAAYRLTQGFDNMSLEAGRKLWQIAEQARANPELRHQIETTSTDDLWTRLEESQDGRQIKAKLQEYLAYYGRRSDTVQELANVSWTEDPRPALDNLKAYVIDGEDPDVTMARLATDREAAIARAREALASHPQDVREQFDALLAAAQQFSRVQEDHNFWIDQRSLHEVRQLCLEFGRRLVERDLLSQPGDVLALYMDEARAALRGDVLDTRALVTERQAEMEQWARVTPPPVVGTDYGPPPDNPITRALLRFFGGPPQEATQPDEVRGNPGSPGKVTGVARVIPTIGDAGRLQQGEILVTPTTAPPWTPFFGTAAAVVTETGGVLSHCAIVAREYGIPAVVGAAGVCGLVKDGATIEVDGGQGIVRLLV